MFRSKSIHYLKETGQASPIAARSFLRINLIKPKFSTVQWAAAKIETTLNQLSNRERTSVLDILWWYYVGRHQC